MDEDMMSTYLLRKLWSNLREAEAEPCHSLSIISCFQSLELQISEKSACGCRIPVDVLYAVMGALSECRVFSYKRPTAKAAYLIHLLHHPLAELFFKRRMSKRLDVIAEDLRSLKSPTAQASLVPLPQSETTLSDIIGFEEEAAQIVDWLIPTSSSNDTSTEIAIVGKWGCGKTTLARKVFATPKIVDKFSPLMFWVCLSGTMYEQEARERVVKCIEEKTGWNDLNGKRYLIVLDDVWWSGGIDLDLPKGALILTTRRDNHDFGINHNHVIRLEPKLEDETCCQIFSQAVNQQGKLDRAEPLLTAMQNDVTRNSRGRPLAADILGTIIPDLLLQRKHWIRARDLGITWSGDNRYWKWSNLPPPEEMEEVAELVDVCWLEIIGSLEMKMLLVNKTYSAYLVYKLKEERQNLDLAMWGGVMIIGRGEVAGEVFIDGHRQPGPLPSAEAEGAGWMEIELGKVFNASTDHGEVVQARIVEYGPWKSGLVVKGISFRLNNKEELSVAL